MSHGDGESWWGIVDCPGFTGDFWRQLIAWMLSDLPPDDMDLMDLMDLVGEENEAGCMEPTPGWWHDGLGHAWPDALWGSPEAHAAYTAAHTALVARGIRGRETAGPTRYPAYHSVRIALPGTPTAAAWRDWQARATRFPWFVSGAYALPVGFRLLRRTVSEEAWESPLLL